jgi:hypothetical protein
MLRKLLVGAMVLELSAACSAISYEPDLKIDDVKVSSDDKYALITSTSDIATTTISERGSKLFSCKAPPPDAAFSQMDAWDISFSIVNNTTDGGDNEEGSTATELSGRTPGLLMSRELLYRTCELSRNYDLKKDKALDLFKKTLDVVSKGWYIEAKNTKITVGDTLTTTTAVTDGISAAATATTSDTRTESTSDSDSTTKSDATSTTDSSS